MNLTKVEKATLATALAIFEDHISRPDNEVSNSNPSAVITCLIVVKILIAKLDLEEIWEELHKDDK